MLSAFKQLAPVFHQAVAEVFAQNGGKVVAFDYRYVSAYPKENVGPGYSIELKFPHLNSTLTCFHVEEEVVKHCKDKENHGEVIDAFLGELNCDFAVMELNKKLTEQQNAHCRWEVLPRLSEDSFALIQHQDNQKAFYCFGDPTSSLLLNWKNSPNVFYVNAEKYTSLWNQDKLEFNMVFLQKCIQATSQFKPDFKKVVYRDGGAPSSHPTEVKLPDSIKPTFVVSPERVKSKIAGLLPPSQEQSSNPLAQNLSAKQILLGYKKQKKEMAYEDSSVGKETEDMKKKMKVG